MFIPIQAKVSDTSRPCRDQHQGKIDDPRSRFPESMLTRRSDSAYMLRTHKSSSHLPRSLNYRLPRTTRDDGHEEICGWRNRHENRSSSPAETYLIISPTGLDSQDKSSSDSLEPVDLVSRLHRARCKLVFQHIVSWKPEPKPHWIVVTSRRTAHHAPLDRTTVHIDVVHSSGYLP